MGRWTMILGGARSGKSAFAMELAKQNQNGREVVFLASAVATDEEMRSRIARHRASRPRDWRTVEEPLRLRPALEVLGAESRLILWDCMTFYLNNFIFEWEQSQQPVAVSHYPRELEETLLQEAGRIAGLKQKMAADLILISNEVGSGLVPENELGRFFRDVAGRINQRLAQAADEVFFLTAGIPTRIK